MTYPHVLQSFSPPGAPQLSAWELAQFQKPYIHEAAHAVVARLTGYPVKWVSVDQSFIDADPEAIERGCAGIGPTCMTLSSEKLKPVLDRGFFLTKDERQSILGYVMHVLAGPIAECRFDDKSFDEEVGNRDFEQVQMVLALCSPDKRQRKDLYKIAYRQLDRLLDERWSSIISVANALVKRQTLYGHEIDELVASDAPSMREAV